MADDPRVIVLAGANGAGKATASRTLLAETLHTMTFVNADAIAQGLSGFAPDAAAFEAGGIMLERLQTLAARREDFAFETTLSGRTYAGWLDSLKQAGYRVALYYFWLATPDLNVARVAQRVRLGGHDIPEATIRQRYGRGIRNFLKMFRPIVDSWRLFETTLPGHPVLIAEPDKSGERILDEARWAEFLRRGGDG